MNTCFKSRRLFFNLTNFAGAVLLVLLSSYQVAVAGTEINTGYFGNVAIKGYDPVAYFTQGSAKQGSEEHTYKWLGAVWRFTTPEHKRMFAGAPMKYAPQYGGHCALGTAGNTLTKDIDPEAWAIIDDKLYLNYSKEVNKLLNDSRIQKADANWQQLRIRAAQ